MDERVGQIVSLERLVELREQWRREPKCVVLTVGAFDLLHPGHVRLLEQARSLGDILVVVLVDNIEEPGAKGENWRNSRGAPARLIMPVSERAEILAAMAAVDFVTMLQDVSAADWIDRFRPNVHVKGGAAESEVRQESATQPPGQARIVSIPLEPGYSTGLLIERIQQLKQ